MEIDFYKSFFDLGIIVKEENSFVSLKEDGNDAKLKNLKVKISSTDSIVIKSDKIKIENLFQGNGRGQRTHCDYVIINNDRIYFIELKSTFRDEKLKEKIINQFRGTLCITSYIDSVLSVFYDMEKSLEKKERLYILLYLKIPIAKTTTSLKKRSAEKNNQPHQFKSIQVTNNDSIDLDSVLKYYYN